MRDCTQKNASSGKPSYDSPVADGSAALEASHHCNAEHHEGPVDSWDVDLPCKLLRGVPDVQPREAPQIDGLSDN